jgi:hypothetical protein
MAGLAGATRWAARSAGAVVALVVLSFGGWTHQTQEAQYLGATATLPTGPAAETASAADPAPSGTARPTATVKPRWWSGASGSKAANGTYGRWRGETLTIGGTWDNGNDLMVGMKSICPGGPWAAWRKPLDVAIGAIDTRVGESWAKAAAGAYDARWTKNLQKIKQCWGSRDPGLLYIRFAHELNLKDMRWKVKGGEEAYFVKAITRYSTLRYKILPKAKVVLCTSDGTSDGLGIDIHKLWPGKDSKGRQVVDVYAVDTYNSWVVIRDEQEFNDKLNRNQSGMPLGIEGHRLMAVSWGVPFAVAEWSGNGDPKDEGHGADLPIYYKLMNDWFRAHAADPKHPQPGQLLYEIQFNDQPRFELLPTTVQPKSARMYRSLKWGE